MYKFARFFSCDPTLLFYFLTGMPSICGDARPRVGVRGAHTGASGASAAAVAASAGPLRVFLIAVAAVEVPRKP